MGWNRAYPYNPGDLKDSIAVANNYLEGGASIPWDDLRYLFGEIFYGGHITDNYDRVLCSACLQAYVRAELLEGNMPLFTGFATPGGPLNYKGTCQFGAHSSPSLAAKPAEKAEKSKHIAAQLKNPDSGPWGPERQKGWARMGWARKNGVGQN